VKLKYARKDETILTPSDKGVLEAEYTREEDPDKKGTYLPLMLKKTDGSIVEYEYFDDAPAQRKKETISLRGETEENTYFKDVPGRRSAKLIIVEGVVVESYAWDKNGLLRSVEKSPERTTPLDKGVTKAVYNEIADPLNPGVGLPIEIVKDFKEETAEAGYNVWTNWRKPVFDLSPGSITDNIDWVRGEFKRMSEAGYSVVRINIGKHYLASEYSQDELDVLLGEAEKYGLKIHLSGLDFVMITRSETPFDVNRPQSTVDFLKEVLALKNARNIHGIDFNEPEHLISEKEGGNYESFTVKDGEVKFPDQKKDDVFKHLQYIIKEVKKINPELKVTIGINVTSSVLAPDAIRAGADYIDLHGYLKGARDTDDYLKILDVYIKKLPSGMPWGISEIPTNNPNIDVIRIIEWVADRGGIYAAPWDSINMAGEQDSETWGKAERDKKEGELAKITDKLRAQKTGYTVYVKTDEPIAISATYHANGKKSTESITIGGKKVESYEYYDTGKMKRSEKSVDRLTPADKGVVEAEYNSDGNPTKLVKIDGTVEETTYHINGKLATKKVTSKGQEVESYEYYDTGKMKRSEKSVDRLTPADKGVVEAEYNSDGNPTKLVKIDGTVEVTTYHANGVKATVIIEINGKAMESYAWDNKGNWVSSSKDKSRLTDEDKGVLKSEYRDGKLVKLVKVDGTVETTTYHANGIKATVVIEVNGKAMESYAWDDKGKRVFSSKDKSRLTAEDKGVLKTIYKNGKPESMQKADGTVERLTYHANGEQATTKIFDRGKVVESYAWNDKGIMTYSNKTADRLTAKDNGVLEARYTDVQDPSKVDEKDPAKTVKAGMPLELRNADGSKVVTTYHPGKPTVKATQSIYEKSPLWQFWNWGKRDKLVEFYEWYDDGTTLKSSKKDESKLTYKDKGVLKAAYDVKGNWIMLESVDGTTKKMEYWEGTATPKKETVSKYGTVEVVTDYNADGDWIKMEFADGVVKEAGYYEKGKKKWEKTYKGKPPKKTITEAGIVSGFKEMYELLKSKVMPEKETEYRELESYEWDENGNLISAEKAPERRTSADQGVVESKFSDNKPTYVKKIAGINNDVYETRFTYSEGRLKEKTINKNGVTIEVNKYKKKKKWAM
ncbi:hypothetical protein HY772_08995, partial [Candidatus Woesearchaeota archaeon]|nr:hypothetical protein [Candidatus Woesearchaeota archaeon]